MIKHAVILPAVIGNRIWSDSLLAGKLTGFRNVKVLQRYVQRSSSLLVPFKRNIVNGCNFTPKISLADVCALSIFMHDVLIYSNSVSTFHSIYSSRKCSYFPIYLYDWCLSANTCHVSQSTRTWMDIYKIHYTRSISIGWLYIFPLFFT